MWYEPVVKVHKTTEATQLWLSFKLWKFTDGLYFSLQLGDALVINVMPKEVEFLHTKNVLAWVYYYV